LVARFYASAEQRHRTTILMLAGSGGGFPDDAAARDLTISGYRVLALAYVRNWQGQPAELTRDRLIDVPLEYIFTALDWLRPHREVRTGGIAIMGESRGAELALLVGSYRQDVAGVIAFSPSELRWGAVRGGGRLGHLTVSLSPTHKESIIDPIRCANSTTCSMGRRRSPLPLRSRLSAFMGRSC